jgi:probable HAF family extracellular repeat protein
MFDLGTLPGHISSEAGAINDRGQVVGRQFRLACRSHSCGPLATWHDDRFGNFRRKFWRGKRHQQSRQVAGSSETASGEIHAFLWEDGVMTDLGTLPGANTIRVNGINNRGQIVGLATI